MQSDKEGRLFWESADREDDRLAPQNNHFVGACLPGSFMDKRYPYGYLLWISFMDKRDMDKR